LAGNYVVTKINDILEKIIPFFDNYTLKGSKLIDFEDFKDIAELMRNKSHLTSQGLKKIKLIKSTMNTGRPIKMINTIMKTTEKRYYSTASNLKHFKLTCTNDRVKFNQWLAGLIDGNGHFILTKKGYVNFKIIMDIKDKPVLYEIKHKFGGFIKCISNSNSIKYKLNHKKGILDLIHSVNGLIINPFKMLQLNKLCVKYNIKLKEPLPLTYNNG
jgi:hypothetical protein